jgi:hypothetical protein
MAGTNQALQDFSASLNSVETKVGKIVQSLGKYRRCGEGPCLGARFLSSQNKSHELPQHGRWHTASHSSTISPFGGSMSKTCIRGTEAVMTEVCSRVALRWPTEANAEGVHEELRTIGEAAHTDNRTLATLSSRTKSVVCRAGRHAEGGGRQRVRQDISQ